LLPSLVVPLARCASMRCLLLLLLLLLSIPGHAQQRIRIGAPLPLSGALAPEAATPQRGYDLWAEVVNAAGGISVGGNWHKVEIVYLDYRSDTKRARQAIEELLCREKVQFLFAPYGSAATRQASPIAEKHQVP